MSFEDIFDIEVFIDLRANQAAEIFSEQSSPLLVEQYEEEWFFESKKRNMNGTISVWPHAHTAFELLQKMNIDTPFPNLREIVNRLSESVRMVPQSSLWCNLNEDLAQKPSVVEILRYLQKRNISYFCIGSKPDEVLLVRGYDTPLQVKYKSFSIYKLQE